jgi:hypothetical protein
MFILDLEIFHAIWGLKNPQVKAIQHIVSYSSFLEHILVPIGVFLHKESLTKDDEYNQGVSAISHLSALHTMELPLYQYKGTFLPLL